MIREALDQAAHWVLGYAMARSWRKTVREGKVSRAQAIEKVMSFAEARERAQNPEADSLGEGSLRDLRWWRKGAEAGAG